MIHDLLFDARFFAGCVIALAADVLAAVSRVVAGV